MIARLPVEWRNVEIDIQTCTFDGGPIWAVASYIVPGTDERVQFTGAEEHEAFALAKIDVIRRARALLDELQQAA